MARLSNPIGQREYKMNDEKCSACGIFIGGIEEPNHYLNDYRGHSICGWCLINWQYREELNGEEITWEEFLSGKIKEKAR